MNRISTEELYNPIYDSLSISEKQELLNKKEEAVIYYSIETYYAS